MCEDICNSSPWRHQLARGQSFYPNLDPVEIACYFLPGALAKSIHRRMYGATSNTIQSHILRPNSIRASPGRRQGTNVQLMQPIFSLSPRD